MKEKSLYSQLMESIALGVQSVLNEYTMNYQWCIGKNYYLVKGTFLKRGFRLVDSACEIHEDQHYGLSVLDSGGSRVYIRTELFRNPNTGRLNCGKILNVTEEFYD